MLDKYSESIDQVIVFLIVKIGRISFLLLFDKFGIPHRLDVGFPPSFSPIKRRSPSSLNSYFSPPLKAYLEYYPIVLGIYFLP